MIQLPGLGGCDEQSDGGSEERSGEGPQRGTLFINPLTSKTHREFRSFSLYCLTPSDYAFAPLFICGYYQETDEFECRRKKSLGKGYAMLREDLKNQLVERLKAIDPYKIIMFGSHAYDEPRPESDIDLLVVAEDDFLPENFAQK